LIAENTSIAGSGTAFDGSFHMKTMNSRRIAVAVLCGLLLTVTPEWARGNPMGQRANPFRLLRFIATAYCKGSITAAGTAPYRGVVAADPDVLPLGATIEVQGLSGGDYTFTVMDTGRKVQGRHIDVYHPNCHVAKEFGRRLVGVRILSGAS
jgi:3D (Asp-Asp-Asp) domain-containing protein